jgi:hypothetical protein
VWNIFKFFFVWFWLGLAAFVGVVLIAPKPEPRIAVVHKKQVAVPQSSGAGVVGLFLGFTMCIPSYFIARPKRVLSGESHYAA